MAKKAGGAGDFLKKPAGAMRPFKQQPLRIRPNDDCLTSVTRQTYGPNPDPESWSGVTGTRFVMAEPAGLSRGPIRGKALRATKVDGYD